MIISTIKTKASTTTRKMLLLLILHTMLQIILKTIIWRSHMMIIKVMIRVILRHLTYVTLISSTKHMKQNLIFMSCLSNTILAHMVALKAQNAKRELIRLVWVPITPATRVEKVATARINKAMRKVTIIIMLTRTTKIKLLHWTIIY